MAVVGLHILYGGQIMKKFDETYELLKDMYSDEYYPTKCVDKIKLAIQKVIDFLEEGQVEKKVIQEKLDEMTRAINDLEDEFEENGSEIETVARDSIGVTVEYMLDWFSINIDVEDAIAERDW